MFPYDERAAVLELCRTASRKEGNPLDSPAKLWNYFIEKTKANLHIVLCLSPIGDAFRCAASPRVRKQVRQELV
jgi:dynein heavy chain, axonemal